MSVSATAEDGSQKIFQVKSRIDTPVEVTYFLNGGILNSVLRDMLK